ncbi:MAG TPA: chorismate mutase [Candidatus Dormibacteraeota bacterium]|jgi:chorismate mutase
MPVRGIRGATTAARNSSEAIVEATTELLVELARLNELDRDEVCFAYFTTTLDLDAEFPALAARRMGWTTVPLLCGNDMVVPGPNPRSVPMCIRILLLYNTDKAQSEMKSAYLRRAQAIRADLDRTAGELNIQ